MVIFYIAIVPILFLYIRNVILYFKIGNLNSQYLHASSIKCTSNISNVSTNNDCTVILLNRPFSVSRAPFRAILFFNCNGIPPLITELEELVASISLVQLIPCPAEHLLCTYIYFIYHNFFSENVDFSILNGYRIYVFLKTFLKYAQHTF